MCDMKFWTQQSLDISNGRKLKYNDILYNFINFSI